MAVNDVELPVVDAGMVISRSKPQIAEAWSADLVLKVSFRFGDKT